MQAYAARGFFSFMARFFRFTPKPALPARRRRRRRLAPLPVVPGQLAVVVRHRANAHCANAHCRPPPPPLPPLVGPAAG